MKCVERIRPRPRQHSAGNWQYTGLRPASHQPPGGTREDPSTRNDVLLSFVAFYVLPGESIDDRKQGRRRRWQRERVVEGSRGLPDLSAIFKDRMATGGRPARHHLKTGLPESLPLMSSGKPDPWLAERRHRYDISDYRGIMKEFGAMQDFDDLLKGMHSRGIKMVLDLVVNHSSDEHPWFKQSRSSRDNPYRDYYHWWPAEKGKPAHRWSFFDVNGDAWKFDEKTNSYYLHYFSQKQPDLNWENPKVREDVFSMMRFWFDKGVDGFRMDVIPFISKDTTFPPIPPEFHGDYVRFYANGPHTHEYLQAMNKEVLSKYDVMSVAEGIGVTTDDVLKYVDADRHELNMAYHFEGVGLGILPGSHKIPDPKGYSLIDFKNVYSKWDAAFAEKGWGTIYLGNHDQPRMTTRWGNDSLEAGISRTKC